MNFIQLLLPTIEHFHTIAYWLAFLVALLETTIGLGLFLPGSTIILFMGALAAKGHFDLGDLLWFAIFGAIIGDNINYIIGKKYGNKIFAKGFWFIKSMHFKKGQKFFINHGSRSVFFGRFIPSLKEVIPLIAGIFNMKRTSFIIWNILGAIGWSLVWILPGYFFAQSLDLAKIWLSRLGFFLTILFVLFIIFYILKIIFIKKGKEFFSFLFSIWQSVKQAVIKNTDVQKFINRHQLFFRFIKKRLDRDNFYGLSLTLLFFALLYLFFLLGGVIEDIMNSDIIVFTDIRIINLLTIFRDPRLVKFFLWVTLLGKWQIIFIFTVGTSLILWLHKKQFYIIPLLLSIISSEIFTFIGKIIFHRPRPELAVYLEHSFSFPSGHATIAVAFYGFLAYLLIKSSKEWKRKVNIFFLTIFLIMLIGFSRLYLGVHYFSDVWGGYLIGAIWLVIAIRFSEHLLNKKFINLINVQKRRLLTGVIIFISIGLYLIFAFYYQMPSSSLSQPVNQVIISNDVMSILNTDQLKYTETLLGNKQEPISFIIIAKNDQQLVNLFQKAGWSLADEVSISSIIKLSRAVIWKESYSQAPMTPDFWHASVHNFGFEKLTNTNNVRSRHHARFWKTNYITKNGNIIYLGTASFDSGVKWGITHKINPDIDTEREFLFNDLQKTKQIINFEKKQSVKPKIGSNFSGDLFFTDGKLYLISI